MKKQRKQLIILLAALVILAAAVPGVRFLTEKQEQKDAEAARTEQEQKVLVDAAYEDIVKVSYDYEENHYAFEKTEGAWQASEERERNIRESSIQNILSGVTPLYVQQTIENVTDFAQYGLDQPQRTIAFETAAASYILYVGDYNSLTETYYVSRPSENKVYTVEQSVITRFNQTYDDVTEAEEESSEEETSESEASEEGSPESEAPEEGTPEGESIEAEE